MCDDGTADLLDLIHLGLTAAGLEVQDLRHAIAGEDVVVAPDTLDKAKMEQQGAKVIEAEVRILMYRGGRDPGSSRPCS